MIEKKMEKLQLDQNATMLRIIAKFDHVEMPVVTLEQVRL